MNSTVLYSTVFIGSVLISSISQILLKKSADRPHQTGLKEYLNPLVILAYFLFFASTFITIFAYKGVPLSIGPILESTGYVFVAVLGTVFLKEKLTPKKLIGIGIIVLGVILFSLGGV